MRLCETIILDYTFNRQYNSSIEIAFCERMKKMKRFFLLTIGLISLVIISGFLKLFCGEDISNAYESKPLAFYLESADGGYILKNDYSFPTTDYLLNTEKSVCKNGSLLEQDITTRKINTNVSHADSCNLYFERMNVLTLKFSAVNGTFPGGVSEKTQYIKYKPNTQEVDVSKYIPLFTADDGCGSTTLICDPITQNGTIDLSNYDSDITIECTFSATSIIPVIPDPDPKPAI